MMNSAKRRAVRFAALAAVSSLPAFSQAQVATSASGTVYFEAESFSNSIPRGVRAWEVRTDVAGYSGSGFVVATNNGADAVSNINTSVTSTSPELQYGVNFVAGGTYRIWARVYGADPNEDSIHLGLDGAGQVNSSNLNWGVYGEWTWTNASGGVARSLTVGAAGLHTFNLWMREDNARVDRFVLATDVNFRAVIGNAFHIPNNVEPDLPRPTMRYPLSLIHTNTAVEIYSGNQFQGGANGANQLVTGSALFYRVGTGTWNSIAMTFATQGVVNANNKYFKALIPAGTFQPGDVVQYYLRAPYSDRLPTYMYGTDSTRQESETETDAQAAPYTFTVIAPGSYLSITSLTAQGSVEARIFTNTGDISVVGPDLDGNPLANSVDLTPSARIGGVARKLGAVQSWTPYSNGYELVQQVYTGTVTSRLTFLTTGVARYEVVSWNGLAVDQTLVTAPSDTNEHFFGLGEKFNSVDQTGNNVRMLTWDPAGDKGDQVYKAAPWFLSTRGYGFHLDSTAESYFDLRAASASQYAVSNLHPSLKFNIVYGPRLPDVVSRYTEYSGRPAVPPAWAFAPWMSSDKWRTGGEVRYVITKMIERDIPGSVFVFDSPWAVGYNDFNWNMTQFGMGSTNESVAYAGFASVSDMMNFIRTNGYKAICWMTPFVNKSSVNPENVAGLNTGQASTYSYASNNGYFVKSGTTNGPPLVVDWWKGTGSPVDFTKPAAAAWWQLQLSNLVAQSGGVIGGFKTDDGETSNGSDTYIPTNAAYANGKSGVEMRNGYCIDYHRTVWNVLQTNGVLFARSGFTGSQAYPGYWSGDNAPNFGQANGLLSVIVAGQSAGLCGFSIWGHDIGGYQVNNNPAADINNLFSRWAQFGAFSPIFQMHRQTDGLYYPWSFNASALGNYRSYAKLHTALFPYIYTYACQSSTSGLPIIRHPVLFNQGDAAVYGLNHTFFFGNELLVAPATAENQTQRNVYLPAGLWYEYWTNRVYAGGQNIGWTNADQTKIGLFVRAGAIIPMISTNVQTLVDNAYIGHTNLVTMDGSLEFLVYPASNSSFTVYDGTAANCTSNDTVVTFGLSSVARRVALKIFAPLPAGVQRDGVRLPKFTNDASFAAASLGWRYDSAGSFVLVKFPHPGGSTQVTLGPDTIGDGIPNSWRDHYFGTGTSTNSSTCAACDADGDGVSNQDEYKQGTSPADGADYLRISGEFRPAVPGTNAVQIVWPGVPGIPYRVGWKDGLEDALPWQLTSAEYTGNSSVLQWFDSEIETGAATNGRRAYRIVVP